MPLTGLGGSLIVMAGGRSPSHRGASASRRRRTNLVRVVVLATLVAAGTYAYRELRPTAELPEPPAPVARATPPAPVLPPAPPLPRAPATPEAPELPALDESDPAVRELAAGASTRREFGRWLGGSDLVRRFTVSVENVADGHSPGRHMRELRPRRPFRVAQRQDRVYVDPRSYARYDAVAEVFASLDTGFCVALYARVHPLLDQAYADLGHPEGDFDGVVGRAMDELLAAPVVDGDVELGQDVLTYEFLDPDLEALSPAQKQLLRMGPHNVRLVQGKLREFAAALGIPLASNRP